MHQTDNTPTPVDFTAYVDPIEVDADQPSSPEELFAELNDLFDDKLHNAELAVELMQELQATFEGDPLRAKIDVWYHRFSILQAQLKKAQGEFVDLCDQFLDRDGMHSVEDGYAYRPEYGVD